MASSSVTLTDLLDPLKNLPGLASLKRKIAKQEEGEDAATTTSLKAKPKRTSRSAKQTETPAEKSKRRKLANASLPKHVLEKINRKVAYEEASKDVTKWEPIVKQNRQKDHLSFPLNAAVAPTVTSASLNASFQPETELEKEVNALLEKDHIVSSTEESHLLSSMTANPISVSELRQRQIELQKLRSMAFFQEKKLRHAAKIKSKSYRRIKKKEKLKALELALLSNDTSLVEKEMAKQELERARERITLRHKNVRKLASQLLKNDESSSMDRDSVLEDLKRVDLLKKKIMGVPNDDFDADHDADEDQSRYEESTDNPSDISVKSGLMKMKFMNKTNAATSTSSFLGDESNDEGEEADLSDEDEGNAAQADDGQAKTKKNTVNLVQEDAFIGKRSFTAVERREMSKEDLDLSSANTARVSFALPLQDADEMVDASESDLSRSHQQYADESEDSGGSNPWLEVRQPDASILQPKLSKGASALENVAKKQFKKRIVEASTESNTATGKGLFGKASSAALLDKDDEEEDDLEVALKPDNSVQLLRDLVQRAFANDELTVEFEEKKKTIMEEEAPKDRDITLPGWGSWGGPGTEFYPKKRIIVKAKPGDGVAPENRKDAALKHVIINERKLKSIEKYQVASVPFPYDNKLHYEMSQRMPLGKEWNTASIYQRNIKPRIEKAAGSVIAPIKLPKSVAN